MQQTGFDPTGAQASAPPPSGSQRGGEVVRGAARGALVGTVGVRMRPMPELARLQVPQWVG
ncbi:MAG TPA: hypothetical protein VFY96_12245 [Candidatus Binatia bacterium]|nr:hypothetical protein [Candidatus Binatia bacterium]